MSMSEDDLNALAAAAVLSFDRVELSNAETLAVLERTAAVIRLRDSVDEAALVQIVNGEGLGC
jgi:hypothetical protein